ncbi:MAG: hypothetical protein GY794_04710, partial [bacterium]|nr:hypothetical protein [bacterium]
WASREKEVLDRFAPDSLMPSLIAAMAIEDLRSFINEYFWDVDSLATASELSAGGPGDLTVAASQHLHDIAEGTSSVEQWLEIYGHRAPDEFDLGATRWRETPDLVARLAERMKGSIPPLERHEARSRDLAGKVSQMAASLSSGLRKEFTDLLAMVHRYIRFREDSKHYLMLGYDLLRDLLIEAGRRLDIGDGVNLLSIEELHDALVSGVAPLHLIEKRREVRMA